jgi:hypothetical protein
MREGAPTSPSKRRVRFALGSPDDQQSYVWQAWTQGDEAYLAPRELAWFLKVSLHSSGSWRSAWVSDKPLIEQVGGERPGSVWKRPPEFYPGWTEGATVLFPGLAPLGWPAEKAATAKKVTWLEPPSEGTKVTVTLFFAAPDVVPKEPPPTPEPDSRILADLALRTMGDVWVVARRLPMQDYERLDFERWRQERAVEPSSVGPGGWMLLAHTTKGGAPLFVEMRVPKRQR